MKRVRWSLGGVLGSTPARFAVVSLVPVVVLGSFLNSAVRSSIRVRTADVYGSMTEVMFHMAGDLIIRPEDFADGRPLPAERQAAVEALLSRVGADAGTLRLRIVDQQGRVLYANQEADRAQATSPVDGPVRRALHGETATRFVKDYLDPAARTGRQDLIEIYLPITFDGDPKVYGAIIATGINGSQIQTIDHDVHRMQTTLALGLASLWLALLPIASSLSRRLRRKSQENEALALYDTLTGLPNRNLLAERLSAAIEVAGRTSERVGLLLVDLDRFKEVNDTLGHGRGDELLQRVAGRLLETIGRDGTVARLGGDEFAVLLPSIEGPACLASVSDRISAALADAITVEGVDVDIQASIGGATFPDHGELGEVLLQHADIAMYAAKASEHVFVCYSAEIDSHSPRRLALAADLRRALASNGQIVLHYQPVASPVTGEVKSMEALVRWHHPHRGLLQPADFIPMAEQSGLICNLTTKVLDLAVRQAREWMDAGLDLSIAVNLSALDLRSMTLLDDVVATLARHRVPPHRLELEVTETGILAHPETAVQLVAALRAAGVHIALDDFGTGYSSLTYLKKLSPDRLKIDRSFVDAMTHDSTDAEIVRSLIELAHSLAIGVTAEGVETEQHWNLLRDLACDLVQGYYLARPLEAPAAAAWVRERSRSLRTGSVVGSA
jgi:diguanylate cyclase (GGDEF)-like protein